MKYLFRLIIASVAAGIICLFSACPQENHEKAKAEMKEEISKREAEVTNLKEEIAKREAKVKELNEEISKRESDPLKYALWGIGAFLFVIVGIVCSVLFWPRSKQPRAATETVHNKCPHCGTIRPDGAQKCPNPKCCVRF